MLSLLALLAIPTARADCPNVASALEDARQAVLSLDDAGASAALTTVASGFGCGPWARPEDIGRLWLIEGARAALAGHDDEAVDAFAAAHRLMPDLWDADLGPDLRRRYDEAITRPAPPPGEIRVNPAPTDLTVMLDGTPIEVPHLTAGGLHVIQIGPREGPAVFARVFLLPADELLVIDSGLPEHFGEDLSAASASVAKSQPRLDPAVEAEITDLRRKAARDWGDIEASTRGSDDRAERLLRDYVKRYGDVKVGPRDRPIPVDFPQVEEARSRLDALPAARASAAEARASEDALQASFGGSQGEARSAEDSATGLLRAVQLRVGGAWTHAGSDPEGGEAYGGLGPQLGLGVDLRLKGTLGIHAEAGFRGVYSVPDSELPERGIDPQGTTLNLGYGALALSWRRQGLSVEAGPVYALGGGEVAASSGLPDPESLGLPPDAPLVARVRAGGLLLGAGYTAVYAGHLRLGPAVRLGGLSDLDRFWPVAELSATVSWAP